MALEDKSLEELRACEAKISAELSKKRDEKIMSEGGFICSVCKKVFPADKMSNSHPGMCNHDGYVSELDESRTFFGEIEKSPEMKVFAISFGRTFDKKISVGSELGQSSVHINGLILERNGHYFEMEPDYSSCGMMTRLK